MCPFPYTLYDGKQKSDHLPRLTFTKTIPNTSFSLTHHNQTVPEIYSVFLLQFSSLTQSCLTLWDPMNCSTLGFLVQHQLRVHSNSRPSSRWCYPGISSSVVPFPPTPIPPSIRVFSNESTLRMSSAYQRLLIFLWAILIPAWASSSPAFLMMYSA